MKQSEKINRHTEYYLALATILALGLFLVVVAAPNKNLQMLIVLLTTLFYAGFGIFHHMVNHDLNGKIVLEYFIIAGFGIAAVFFLLKGGLGL
ncbi:MAG: hypothetical protein HYT08_01890 [Candidatus Levybacteria bacterium]|nr:hypothetical protein [Candidatus Levybacteria bacterium]